MKSSLDRLAELVVKDGVDVAALAQSLQPTAAVLQGMDVAEWVIGLRAAVAAQREQRRQAWQERHADSLP